MPFEQNRPRPAPPPVPRAIRQAEIPMIDLLLQPSFWAALFSVTLIQIALGADNLIIITIIANKLPEARRQQAIQLGLILAMALRIVLLLLVSLVLQAATAELWRLDGRFLGVDLAGRIDGKSLVLAVGGLFLIWKGVKELRIKLKAVEHEVARASRFAEVVTLIVGMNLIFSVDSILTVVGMTDIFAVMVGSVLISVALMLAFAAPISRFLSANPEFEILGLFVLLLIGFVLILEGGHSAHLTVNGAATPYIPQWIVIFILLLMFAVDLYQNWWERKRDVDTVTLHRRRK